MRNLKMKSPPFSERAWGDCKNLALGDTRGCILPGTTQQLNYVGNSRTAFNTIMQIVATTQESDAENGEQTTITVNIQ